MVKESGSVDGRAVPNGQLPCSQRLSFLFCNGKGDRARETRQGRPGKGDRARETGQGRPGKGDRRRMLREKWGGGIDAKLYTEV